MMKINKMEIRIDPSMSATKGAFVHVGKPLVEFMDEKYSTQQYYLKNLKIANKILNEERVKEIYFYHIPSWRGETLFEVGEKNNIFHFPMNKKEQTISSGNFRKYFLISVNKGIDKGITIRFVEWVPIKNGWEDRLVISIPRSEMIGTAIIRREYLDEGYITSLIIPCFTFTPHFIFERDVFEKYKKYKK